MASSMYNAGMKFFSLLAKSSLKSKPRPKQFHITFPETWEERRAFIDTSFQLIQEHEGRITKIKYEKYDVISVDDPLYDMHILTVYVQPYEISS